MTRKSYQQGYYFEENGVWYLRYWERDHYSGKWKHPKKRLGVFKNEKAARLFGDSIVAQANERNNTPPKKIYSDMTFTGFVNTTWRNYEQTHAHAPATLNDRQYTLTNHLLPVFGSKKLREIKPQDVSDFMHSLSHYAPGTQNNIYCLLRLLFAIAVEFDLINKSPVRPKRHRPKTVATEKPTLTAEQIRKVIDLMPTEQEKLLVLLLSYTALRINEALALQWQDFDATASILHVRHTLYRLKVKPAKTESSVAKIQLPPLLSGALENHRHSSGFTGDGDFIFCRADGRPIYYLACLRSFHAALKAIGIQPQKHKHGFHLLRHSAGTLAFAETGNLKLVQQGLRHSNSSTTADIYVHLSDKQRGEFGKLLDAKIDAFRTRTVPDKAKESA